MRRSVSIVALVCVVAASCASSDDSNAGRADRGQSPLVTTRFVPLTDGGSETTVDASPAETTAPVETAALPDVEAEAEAEESAASSGAAVPNSADMLFMETFDGNTGGDRFDYHVYHRNVDLYDFTDFSGGEWSGDHDLECNSPDTQRPLAFDIDDDQATRIATSVYLCKDHLMTSMGDVESYTIVTFSPKQVFDSVSEVCFDVNLTNLGIAQWFKVGIVTEEKYNSTSPTAGARVPGFLVADVGASDLPHDLDTGDLLLASWSGGLSGGYPGGLKIGNVQSQILSDPTPEDKATRHPVCFTDHQDGTLTFDVAGVQFTTPGVFPPGPVRVVFYDNSYEPNQTCEIDGRCVDGEVIGTTWHWDNITVRG